MQDGAGPYGTPHSSTYKYQIFYVDSILSNVNKLAELDSRKHCFWKDINRFLVQSCKLRLPLGWLCSSCNGNDYTINIPAQCANGNGACGMIFDCHGFTSNSDQQDSFTQLRRIGAENDFVVVQPQANRVRTVWLSFVLWIQLPIDVFLTVYGCLFGRNCFQHMFTLCTKIFGVGEAMKFPVSRPPIGFIFFCVENCMFEKPTCWFSMPIGLFWSVASIRQFYAAFAFLSHVLCGIPRLEIGTWRD